MVSAALQPVAAWTRWFTRLLLGSLYPGAPFERKFLAMLLLEALLSTWNTPDKANRQNFKCGNSLSPWLLGQLLYSNVAESDAWNGCCCVKRPRRSVHPC